MALGPKAMGDAIIANLETKTGKNLKTWFSELKRLKPADKADAIVKLKAAGLGQFQAVSVAAAYFGDSIYASPTALVDTLFAAYPLQRTVFDKVCAKVVDGKMLRLQPCKNYVPIYSERNIIVASFKPTKQGLYLGLRGSDYSFATIAHKRSLGGSDSMKLGVFVIDVTHALQALTEARAK